jgi:hypothetical protein
LELGGVGHIRAFGPEILRFFLVSATCCARASGDAGGSVLDIAKDRGFLLSSCKLECEKGIKAHIVISRELLTSFT